MDVNSDNQLSENDYIEFVMEDEFLIEQEELTANHFLIHEKKGKCNAVDKSG